MLIGTVAGNNMSRKKLKQVLIKELFFNSISSVMNALQRKEILTPAHSFLSIVRVSLQKWLLSGIIVKAKRNTVLYFANSFCKCFFK